MATSQFSEDESLSGVSLTEGLATHSTDDATAVVTPIESERQTGSDVSQARAATELTIETSDEFNSVGSRLSTPRNVRSTASNVELLEQLRVLQHFSRTTRFAVL